MRESLKREASFSKNMLGADFRQSEVKLPVTSDLSGLSFLTAVLIKSAVNREIVALASLVSVSTLLSI